MAIRVFTRNKDMILSARTSIYTSNTLVHAQSIYLLSLDIKTCIQLYTEFIYLP